jgi:SET domain-containing protein
VVIEVVVKRSKINGLGIFTARNFRREQLVIKWSSHRELSKQEVENLPKTDREHVSFINGKYVLAPPDGWVNHSCDSNVRLSDFCYFAKRDIKKGEEITADYREESEKGFEMKCNCRSKNCKGYISVQ